MDANIICEGIDRVGKSTLIANMSGFHNIKMTAPVSLARTFYEYLIYFSKLNGTMKQQEPICFDRGHLSELVYGHLYRPQNYADGVLSHWISKMEERLVQAIATHVELRPTYIVYVEPSNLALMQKDERPNANKHKELALYEYALKRTSLPVIRVTTQTATWKQPSIVIDEIKELLNG